MRRPIPGINAEHRKIAREAYESMIGEAPPRPRRRKYHWTREAYIERVLGDDFVMTPADEEFLRSQ